MQPARPQKLKLFSILTLSLGVLIITAAFTTYFYSVQHSLSNRYYTLKVLAQDITYYDEVLTMSTLVGTHSGEPRWRERYNQHADLLDYTLMTAAKIDPEISHFIQATSEANQLLIAYEERAFDLAKNGDKQQAIKILNSVEYQQAKIVFAEGIKKAIDQVLMETKLSLDKSNQQRGLNLVLGMAASFIIVLGLWAYLLRYIQKTDRKMEGLIKTDDLTGLLNRREFNESLISEVNRAHREKRVVMLAILDLDNFKKYNDYYGHPMGDKALSQFGTLLQKFSRRANELAYRIGGEEFAFITSAEDRDSAIKRVEEIVEQTRALNIPHEHNLPEKRITVSCGVAFSSHEVYIPPGELYQHADEALYQAKEAGKNRFSIYQA